MVLPMCMWVWTLPLEYGHPARNLTPKENKPAGLGPHDPLVIHDGILTSLILWP